MGSKNFFGVHVLQPSFGKCRAAEDGVRDCAGPGGIRLVEVQREHVPVTGEVGMGGKRLDVCAGDLRNGTRNKGLAEGPVFFSSGVAVAEDMQATLVEMVDGPVRYYEQRKERLKRPPEMSGGGFRPRPVRQRLTDVVREQIDLAVMDVAHEGGEVDIHGDVELDHRVMSGGGEALAEAIKRVVGIVPKDAAGWKIWEAKRREIVSVSKFFKGGGVAWC